MLLLNGSSITRIYENGAKAYELYIKYLYEKICMEIIKLPSTSSNNGKNKENEKNILIILYTDVPSFLFPSFFPICHTRVANYNFSKFSLLQLGHYLGHFEQVTG